MSDIWDELNIVTSYDDDDDSWSVIVSVADNPAYEENGLASKADAEEYADEFIADNERALVLASHLNVPFDNIAEDVGGEFVVNQRKIKYGTSPEEVYTDVEFLRRAMAEIRLYGLERSMIEWRASWELDPYQSLEKWISEHDTMMKMSAYHLVTWLFDLNPITVEMKKEGLHRLVNTLYMIMDDDRDVAEKYKAAWRGETLIDDRQSGTTSDGEYLVLTEDERDKRGEEYVESFLDDMVVSQIPTELQRYFDTDSYIRDVLDIDGYGHVLSSYDGEEYEHCGYYIYRTN